MKVSWRWLWIIPLTLLWPLLHTLVFVIRFGDLPPDGLIDAYVFLPMGLVAGIALLVLWDRAVTRSRRVGILLGYLLAIPIAFLGSLMSGLLWPPLVGTVLYGAVPLIVGMLLGMLIGGSLTNNPST